MFSFNNNYMT